MKVTIKETELELHYSLRIYLIYENITGKSLDVTDPSYSVTINLFYSAILASMQYHHRGLLFEYDEYIEWLDSHIEEMNEFIKWFIKNMRVNASITNESKDEEDTREPLPKN